MFCMTFDPFVLNPLFFLQVPKLLFKCSDSVSPLLEVGEVLEWEAKDFGPGDIFYVMLVSPQSG